MMLDIYIEQTLVLLMIHINPNDQQIVLPSFHLQNKYYTIQHTLRAMYSRTFSFLYRFMKSVSRGMHHSPCNPRKLEYLHDYPIWGGKLNGSEAFGG